MKCRSTQSRSARMQNRNKTEFSFHLSVSVQKKSRTENAEFLKMPKIIFGLLLTFCVAASAPLPGSERDPKQFFFPGQLLLEVSGAPDGQLQQVCPHT